MAEARTRFEEGLKLGEAGDHESARLKFNQAWALLKSPAILYNLARAEEHSNHPVEALEHYRQFSKMPPDPKITDAQRQRAAQAIAGLTKKVAQIEMVANAGARITIDGRAIDSVTDPVPVTEGKHVVEASADGKVKTLTVECEAGAVCPAKLKEEAPAAKPPPPRASDTHATTGIAPATSHGSETAETPPPAEQAPGFWTTGRIVGTAIFAGGLLAVGGGVIALSSAGAAEDEANSIRNGLPEPRASACNDAANNAQCAQLKTAVENQQARSDLSTGLFIGGGVLVVGGAVLFLVSSPSSGTSTGGEMRPHLVPIANGREGGLAVFGSF